MSFSKLWCMPVLMALLINLGLLSVAWAQTTRQIAQNTFPSIVLLVMEDATGQPVSLGSGFFVREGVVATNLHVIEGAVKGYAKLVGQRAKYDIAGTVGIDSARDLVLLSVKGAKAPSLSLGDSGTVAVGDGVYAIGNPQGLEGTFSQGIVSGVRQAGPDILFQITAPISPGSSGGPVLNSEGAVIGVAVATFKGGQNLNFAIPVSYVASLMTEIKLVSPLSSASRPRDGKSTSEYWGRRSTEGIVVGQFAWTYETHILPTGEYSVSLRNQLRESVKDVYFLVVFYDRSGSPIDVDKASSFDPIPPGLAKRVTGRVDESVQKLTAKVEFRVLDFKIAE